MAYSTGSASNLGSLLSDLSTFVQAHGWNQDEFDNGATTASEGIASWTKNSISISMKWIANAPNNLSIHQALAYTSSANKPGNHTNDSGNGFNSAFGTDAQLDDERCINSIGNGPFISYHFFEKDASPAYVHVVVQISTGRYRHFGFGEMEKFNTWTGGEYCYGHYSNTSINNTSVRTETSVFADALFSSTTTTAKRAATIHAEGLPNQGGSEKWLICIGGTTSLDSADRLDTNGQIKRVAFGGARGGPVGYGLGPFRSDVATGHIPMYPMAIFLRNFSPNEFMYFLGNIPDIRGIDIFNFSAEQEITIGSDTWIVFPQTIRTEANIVDRSYYQGFAYKKVIA